MAWASIGVDGRSAEGLQSPHRSPMALRELGCAGWQDIGSRESWLVRVGGDVGSVAEGAVRLGVEWLAAGPGRD